MAFRQYRRSSPQSASVQTADPSDPYTAYLSWIASGRPSLASDAPFRSESGALIVEPVLVDAIRVEQHVQVQELGGEADPASRPSAWRRITDVFRRS